VTVEEYLSTAFDGPDREYAEGEVIERNMGGRPHSRIQGELYAILKVLSRRYPTEAYVELRLRLAPNLYRIPDVCLFHGPQSNEAFPSQPPLLAVEVLSPDDTHAAVMQKLEEYRQFGIRHIWLIDPVRNAASVYDESGLHSATSLELPECALTVHIPALFGENPPTDPVIE